MNPLFKRCVLLVLFLFPLCAIADYAWIPEYKTLVTKAGFEFFKTSSNFDSGSSLVDLYYNGDHVELTDQILWAEAEYGIAEYWDIGLRLNFMNSYLNLVERDLTRLAAIGIGNTEFFLKWVIKSGLPLITIENRFVVPTASSSITANDELVLGDGSFDWWLYAHLGTQANKFRFSLSPHFVLRSGGYSPAMGIEGAIEFRLIEAAYFRVKLNYLYSFSDPQLNDSSPDVHDTLGSGNSYARLSGGPIGFDMGAIIGAKLYKGLWLESYLDHAITGNKYPYYLRFGMNLAMGLDFYEPPKKIKVKEVPFESEHKEIEENSPQPEGKEDKVETEAIK